MKILQSLACFLVLCGLVSAALAATTAAQPSAVQSPAQVPVERGLVLESVSCEPFDSLSPVSLLSA